MPKNTSLTFLFYKATEATEFVKLIDINDFPDIYSTPEKQDVSTLSSNQKKYIPGMIDLPDYEFTFWHEKAEYDKVRALMGKNLEYQIRFGINGEYGAWQWSGDVFVTPTGGGVGGVRGGKLTCYPSTDVVDVEIVAPAMATKNPKI